MRRVIIAVSIQRGLVERRSHNVGPAVDIFLVVRDLN